MSPVGRFFRFLCNLEGRNMAGACKQSGISRSTGVRYLAEARRAGILVRSTRRSWHAEYRIVDSGPFDLHRLRRVRWL